MASAEQERTSALALQGLPTADPFQAYVLPLSAWPVERTERDTVLAWWASFVAEFSKQVPVASEVFLQVERIHLEGRAEKLSANAAAWLPTMGLGVWPDRPAPALYTADDFKNLGIGESPRTLMYQVVRLTAAEEETEKAREEMFGMGIVLQMLTSQDGASLLGKFKEQLLPHIEEPAFRGFPFFVPLLDANSISRAGSEQLEAWLPGVTLYLRESPEDKGILLISREPLSEVLTAVGCRRRRVPIPTWDLPGL